MLTVDQFKQLFPNNSQPAAWVEAINHLCPRYEINTPLRIAMFIAQCGHESNGFTRLVECLDYSATALLQNWPRRFTSTTAQEYARQPEKIANHVYANRLGNFDEASGDGWRFRGRGPIQITGRTNRECFAIAVNLPLDAAEKYLTTVDGGVESACWFWKRNGLNDLADRKMIDECSKRINGGTIGLTDRRIRYASALDIFSE